MAKYVVTIGVYRQGKEVINLRSFTTSERAVKSGMIDRLVGVFFVPVEATLSPDDYIAWDYHKIG